MVDVVKVTLDVKLNKPFSSAEPFRGVLKCLMTSDFFAESKREFGKYWLVDRLQNDSASLLN